MDWVSWNELLKWVFLGWGMVGWMIVVLALTAASVLVYIVVVDTLWAQRTNAAQPCDECSTECAPLTPLFSIATCDDHFDSMKKVLFDEEIA